MKKFFAILPLILLSACANEAIFDYSKKSDIEIYEKAMKELSKGNNISATNAFMQVEYNHPYSPLIAKSWYMMGYAYYLEKKYDDAIEQFEISENQFIHNTERKIIQNTIEVNDLIIKALQLLNRK